MAVMVEGINRFLRKVGYQLNKVVVPCPPKVQDEPVLRTPDSDKIHYGCGGNVFRGWLNVDFFVVHDGIDNIDLSARHPFKDESFKFGFSEDFIEHMPQAEQIIFLSEVFRTFQKKGVIRLSFPGLEGVLRRHFRGADYKAALQGKKEAYDMWEHVHFPSYAELSLLCWHIGFSKIRKVEFGKSEFSELCNLDTRDDQMDLNTYVEITK
jgi:predicted SAM-dependent methyltransferase